MRFFVVVFVIAIRATCSENLGTPSRQCPGMNYDDLRDRFQVIPCEGNRCELIKKTNVTVVFKFKPKNELTSLKNRVTATVFGMPLPYMGVDGAEACGANITLAATGARVDCPLAADTEYLYTTTLPVHSYYPSWKFMVTWELESDRQPVMCAQVPAVIKHASKTKEN